MKRLILAIGVALLPWAAHAAPPPAGFAMVTALQIRPQQVGDHYSYVADIQSHVVRGGAASDANERQHFSLEIVKISKPNMVVRFTQTEVEEQSTGADEPGVMLQKAWDGVPVDFATGNNGYPSQIVNEAEVKTRLEANFAAESPKGAATVANLKQWLDGLPDAKFLSLAGERLTALAAMQWRGFVNVGHQDLPTDTHQDPDGGTVLVKQSVDFSISADVACSVLIKRSTWTERSGADAGVSSSLDTEATVAEADGWVISLTEASKTVLPNVQQVRTVKINREETRGCGG